MYLHGRSAGMCFPPGKISSGEGVIHMIVAPIYNREPESSWHAVVPCPQAAGLILAMRNHLLLPDKGRGTIRLHWT
jgi:membrane-associated PAP2 superfamily phosphatase